MKRFLSLTLIFVIVLGIALSSCNKTEENGVAEASGTEKFTVQPTEKPTKKPTERATRTAPPVKDGYSYIHSYVNEELFAEAAKLFEAKASGCAPYYPKGAPYVPADVFGLSDSKLIDVTIPVSRTEEPDEDGNFIFTIWVLKNDLKSLSNSNPYPYRISVSASMYGLESNMRDVHKMIKVDISSYDIYLGADETVAFAASDDTLIPAYLIADTSNSNELYNLLKTKCPQLLGYSSKAGREDFHPGEGSLLFNFSFERVYSTEEEREEAANKDELFAHMLETVKARYAGLNLSVFGDSISTYDNISNSTDYNSTIGENSMWYNQNNIAQALLYDYTYTYWGSMVRELNMNLCVNNSWSGDSLGSRSFMTRGKQLHNNDGKKPDVVVIYYGINDTWEDGRDVGELLELLENKGDKSTHDVVDEWYKNTVAKGEDCHYWDELYAMLLNTIMKAYPDAEIVCVGLTVSKTQDYCYYIDKWVPLYNRAMKAIAEYLGAVVVDQVNVIDGDNCHAYTHDENYDHPNAHGHRVIFEEIIRTLYKKITG